MFRFANTEFLNLLFIIPIILVLFIIALRMKKKAMSRFAEQGLMKELMPDYSSFRPIVRFLLVLIALAIMIVGLARPQFGTKMKEVKREGVELIILLDVSNSMLAEDIKPSRLERSKMAISKLVDQIENDRIGLIVFAGDAYIQVPVTSDYTAVKLFLSSINTNIVPKQGTAIGSAIRLALNSFNWQSDIEKAIIIITDGENHEDDPQEAVKMAVEKGVKIHTLGIGSPQGSPIPEISRNGQRTFRKDNDGNIVVSKLDEVTLQKIAAQSEGKYIRASNANLGLAALFKEIGKMDKKEMEAKVYSEYEDQFPFFFALAFFLLLLELLILERKNKWFSKLKIFTVDFKK